MKRTTEYFIDSANIIHGNRYDYSKVHYVNARTKIIVVCQTHGEFLQAPHHHLDGTGCHKCANLIKRGDIKLTTKSFIDKANVIHNNEYDYSKANYVNSRSDITIICPIHGDFKQIANNHLKGMGCRKCMNLLTNEEFIERVNIMHRNKYSYLKTKYKKSSGKVLIICQEHGEFLQNANLHLSGSGCPKCAGMHVTNEDFIKKARNIHGDKYDYCEVKYVNNREKIMIICPKHDIFYQSPNAHLNGSGCPICKESHGEERVRIFLEKNNIKYEKEKSYNECRNIKPLPFDFYLPNYNMLIEYDGIQHFKSIERWSGDDGLQLRKKRDAIKNNYVTDNNIRLIRIAFYENVEEKLNLILGLTP